MARTVASQTSAAKAAPEINPEFSIDNIRQQDFEERAVGDMPDFDEPAEKRGAGEKAAYQYTPSDSVLKALDELPWEEISKEIPDMTKENMIKKADRYGILEALAYGSWTKSPLYLKFDVGHQKQVGSWCTMRLWHFKNRQTGEMKWGYETHPVSRKYVLDKQTGEIVEKDGKKVTEWDVNPVRKGDILKYGDVTLSSEQCDQIRLTGMLEEPIMLTDFNGRPQTVIVGVDKYNNHCLVGVNSDSIFNRLNMKPEFKTFSGETVSLDRKQIGELSIGHGVWIKTEKGPSYIKYNPFEERLRPAVNFERAIKQERAQEFKEAQARAAGQTTAESEEKSRGIR